MKLTSQPKLILTEGRVPNAPGDTRRAVFLDVSYSYESSSSEVSFLEQNDLVIFESVTILGVDPAAPGNDIDLKFSIRPQFTVRPPDQASANFLRGNSFKVDRNRRLFVIKDDLLDALNVNGLVLNSVKANVQLTYTHIGNSDPVNAD